MPKKKQTPPMTMRMTKVEFAFEQIQKAVDIIRTEQAQYHQSFNERFEKFTDEINYLKQAISKINEVELKNGNGRVIKMLRSEFYQMIYDKMQFRFIATRLGKAISILLTLLLVINLIINIFFK